jgi:hypothetical protein
MGRARGNPTEARPLWGFMSYETTRVNIALVMDVPEVFVEYNFMQSSIA